MGKLNDLSITIGRDNKAEIVFDSLFPNFLEVEYEKPSDYIQNYWNAFKKYYQSSYIKRKKRNKIDAKKII